MKVAVLSDIHGNLEALLAVSADLERRGVDRAICLGDNIGYGPDPEEVVRRIRDLGYVSILGNHEFSLFDQRARRWLNFQAEENNIVTGKLLSEESLTYCYTLPKFLAFDIAYFVHGFPPFSVFRYLNRQSDATLAVLLDTAPFSLLFLGHTHKLQLVRQESGAIVRRPLGEERVELQPGQKYIINAGSVGQPRDGDNRAKYLLWDMAAATLEVLFVAYDYWATMQKIKERGFPEAYATRLG
ncbi:MAG: metallophosphoesterase [Proteobacteria bacterium]|nr:metallophosphoesterase [Pseudomonadota bacterium]